MFNTMTFRSLASAILISMACTLSMTAHAIAGAPKSVNVIAGNLTDALEILAKQCSVDVIYPSNQLKGLKTEGVTGVLETRAAFQKLIEGTPLIVKEAGGSVLITLPASANTAQGEGAKGVNELVRRAQADQSDPMRKVESSENPESQKTKPDSSAEESGGKIQEIVVTARKTRERLQDVPVTVTAVSGELLRKSGATDIKDVLSQIPGLSFSGVERGQSSYAIRGVASGAPKPTTGIFLDDIALVTGAAFDTGAFDPILFDLDRIEVLKGPQGTLYGGSAMGGAIKYVSAKPDLNSVSANVTAGVGAAEHGAESYKATGVLNLPLVPGVLAARGGIYYMHEGGYVDNIAGLNIVNESRSSTPFPIYTPLSQPSLSILSKKDYNSSDSHVGRLSLLWQPDDSWSIRPAAFYQKSTQRNPPYFLTNQDGLVSSYRYTDQDSPDKAAIYSLDVQKTVGSVELYSLTSYFNRRATWIRDYSFYIGGLLDFLYPYDSLSTVTYNFKTFSQELRVASKAGTDGRLTWVAGLYYSDQTTRRLGVVETYETGFIPDDLIISDPNKETLEQSAAFGEATLRLTDSLDLTAGIRAFKAKVANRVYGATGLITSTPGFFEAKDHGLNPKVGLSYKVSRNHLLYASASKGFRPGQANGRVFPTAGCVANLAQLGLTEVPAGAGSDSLWTYEIGSKNEAGDGRFVVNGSLFYSDWKKIQQGVTLQNCGAGFLANAGAARLRGAELEARFTLEHGWQVGGNATFIDAKVVDGGTGSFAGTGDFPQAGDEVLGTPRWAGGVFGSYSTSLTPSWDMEVRADYRYRSKQRLTFVDGLNVIFSDGASAVIPLNNDAVFQPSYDMLNAFVSLDHGPTNVRLYVNNILDEQPILDTTWDKFIARTATLRPRTIGVEFSQQF